VELGNRPTDLGQPDVHSSAVICARDFGHRHVPQIAVIVFIKRSFVGTAEVHLIAAMTARAQVHLDRVQPSQGWCRESSSRRRCGRWWSSMSQTAPEFGLKPGLQTEALCPGDCPLRRVRGSVASTLSRGEDSCQKLTGTCQACLESEKSVPLPIWRSLSKAGTSSQQTDGWYVTDAG